MGDDERRPADDVLADVRRRRRNAEHRADQADRAHLNAVQANHAAKIAADFVNSYADLFDGAGRRRISRLAYFDPGLVLTGSRAAVLTALVDAALTLCRADMGNVQLPDAAGVLRIAAHRGFAPRFLEHFAVVSGDRTACGLAYGSGRSTTVRDVAASPLFGGTSVAVLLEAGARAVHSVPLPGPDGRPAGVLSVHYHDPCAPDPARRRMLDLLATGALRRLNGHRTRK